MAMIKPVTVRTTNAWVWSMIFAGWAVTFVREESFDAFLAWLDQHPGIFKGMPGGLPSRGVIEDALAYWILKMPLETDMEGL